VKTSIPEIDGAPPTVNVWVSVALWPAASASVTAKLYVPATVVGSAWPLVFEAGAPGGAGVSRVTVAVQVVPLGSGPQV
jgi:hypothetical protein